MRWANDSFMLGHDRHDCPDNPDILVMVARSAMLDLAASGAGTSPMLPWVGWSPVRLTEVNRSK
jgi:hypothetical protein